MSGDPPTPLTLPSTLPFPITITRLLAKPSVAIRRGDKLLQYSFTSSTTHKELERLRRGLAPSDGMRAEDLKEWDMVGTWESSIDGEVVRWSGEVNPGVKLDKRQANRPLLYVQQPCSHPVQLHGMCGICGQDLTSDDYLAPPPTSQAGPSRLPDSHEISHDAIGVTVSTNKEARRLDKQTRDTLLSHRKLSLIVDLDQTIIHTTVDPTVGEWMADMGKEESEEPSPNPTREDIAEAGNGEASTTPPGSSDKGKGKERNPNAEALRDVARFHLADDLLLPSRQGDRRIQRPPERWYYTKPRPGLKGFLEAMSEMYEMHVYTMGTRTYAEAICKVVDPEGKFFGSRILSRDESGDFTSKSLKRLFPTDQSMVVVIDDRADVWGDCPNLVKVIPYDFFVGIGDINSSFLPPSTNKPIPIAPNSEPDADSPDSSSSVDSPLPATPDETSSDEALIRQAKLLDDLSEARPLAKKQKELEMNSDPGSAPHSDLTTTTASGKGQDVQPDAADAGPTSSPPVGQALPERPRKPLLQASDYELDRIAKILGRIHHKFYQAFEAGGGDPEAPLAMECDAELIVSEIKAEVLQGCHLIFSGIIPRHIRPEISEIWTTAETFGAICSTSLNRDTTHCVTATLGTEKTYKADKQGVLIVWQGWFWKSVALWQKEDERQWIASKAKEEEVKNGSDQANEPTPDGTQSSDAATIDAAPNGHGSPLPSDSQQEIGEAGPDPEDEDEFNWDAALAWDEDEDEDGDEDDLQTVRDGDSDKISENGSVRSREATPGTPSKKRVRYADEEHLPLESFKDPSPNDPRLDPPKRRKPLLLEAPTADDDIPEANRYQYKSRDSHSTSEAIGAADSNAEEDQRDEGSRASTQGEEDDGEDDDFARMLRDSLDNEEEDDA